MPIQIKDVAGVTLYLAGAGAWTLADPYLPTQENSAAILTSLQLLDDVIATLGGALPAKAALLAGSDGANPKALKTDAAGQLLVVASSEIFSSAVVSSVASSLTSVPLLAANPNRKRVIISNASTQLLYIKLGSGASATSFTVRLATFAYWEIPFTYTGDIEGAWAVVNGSALITEMT